MSEKTNLGLVKHAEKILSQKSGYVWGTFCTKLTETLFKQKLRQYPSGVGNYERFIRENWMGRTVTDCVGLIKGYIFTDENNIVKYNSKYDMSADMMYKRSVEKGDIGGIPEIKGLCVRRKGHIGVYIGNDEVIEAKGTKYGVVKTKLSEGTWTHWLKCPYINYIEDEDFNVEFLGKKVNSTSFEIVNGISKVEIRELFETLGFNVGFNDGMVIVSLK